MEIFISIARSILSDEFIFPLAQAIFLLIIPYAKFKDTRSRFSGIAVTRGDKSWSNLNLAYGIATLILLQLVNSTEVFKGYKTVLSLIDLLGLTYLTFFNSWFRNKVIGFTNASQSMQEKHPS